MLGFGIFSVLESLISVTIPKEYLSWLPAASLSKVDFDSPSSGFRYAIKTKSSMDLKAARFVASNPETVGSPDR